MFDFSHFLNLPLIWGGLIAVSIFLYVVLDGFDLGIGILFPFAPSDDCRSKMMNSIAPFWDGNETWLVLGGSGLLAAFPLAYSILMPAFYIPIILMLLGLIFRGVAFELRFKAHGKARKFWEHAFHFGSLCAGFFQGVMLGAFVQGIAVEDRVFSGGALDWLTPFALMTGVALLFGYALLGATWLILKTTDQTQKWAQKTTNYVLIYVILFMGIVSLWVPFTNEEIYHRWFDMPGLLWLAPIPLLVLLTTFRLCYTVAQGNEAQPFFLAIALFLLSYMGLAISLCPWVVPFEISFHEAAAATESLSLLLVGATITLPFVFAYTAYSYYVFHGKSTHHPLY